MVEYFNEQWTAYEAKVMPIGDAIVAWARNDGVTQASPAEIGNWPFQKFSVAFAIALSYLLFIFVASKIMDPLEPIGKKLYPYVTFPSPLIALHSKHH